MTNAASNNSPQSQGSAFQWWMISNLGVGAGFSALVALLADIGSYGVGAYGNRSRVPGYGR